MTKPKRPITVDDLWRLQRIGAVALSPDGRRAVCNVTRPSMDDSRGRTQLWLLDTTGKAPPRQLTTCGNKDGQAAWSPRGDRIAFLATREQQGVKDETRQLYLIRPDGGEAERATRFAPGIEAFRWLPDGRGVVFAAWVWPDARGAQGQQKRHQAFTKRKESGYATGEADYRRWDHLHPMGRVLHLWHLQLASGRLTDLFEGTRYELPREDLVPEPFDASPDGRHVAFAFDPAAVRMPGNPCAIGEVELATRRVRVLAQDAGWDFGAPRYHPRGQQLAMLAAHKGHKHTMPYRPALVMRGARPAWRALGLGWDHEATSPPRWSADGRTLRLTAESRGRCHLWRVQPEQDHFEIDTEGGWVQAFDAASTGNDEVVVTVADGHSHPARVLARCGAGARRRIERFNDRELAHVALGRVEEKTITGALGEPVQMWLTYPPHFDAKKKHPLLQVIHGGPYTASGDSFSYRWNAHLLAARGHVVAQVNYHGSSGFGFAFKDSIMGRLAELELQDVEAGSDWLLAQPWADPARLFAAGGSYGGFMVAWMNGHVAPGRYRAYVCHAGVFDRVATFAADSYLERPKDLGAFYWDDMARVLAQSPHAFAARMATPTLVTHGALDYRVPDANGLAYYHTLKARGVDARLLWFPDENHWVLKPRNSRLWYTEFHDWLARHDSRPPMRRRTPPRR